MKRWTILIVFLFVSLTGCAFHPRALDRPKVLGDIYVVKTEPAPIVIAAPTEVGTPEAVQSSLLPMEGYVWNDMGDCSLGIELPKGYFEYIVRTDFGPCPAGIPIGYADVTSAKDESGRLICEYWMPAGNLLVIPSGFRTPKLRAPGGRTYEIYVTHTPMRGGRAPALRVHHLTLDFIKGDMWYKGKRADWGITFSQCQALY